MGILWPHRTRGAVWSCGESDRVERPRKVQESRTALSTHEDQDLAALARRRHAQEQLEGQLVDTASCWEAGRCRSKSLAEQSVYSC